MNRTSQYRRWLRGLVPLPLILALALTAVWTSHLLAGPFRDLPASTSQDNIPPSPLCYQLLADPSFEEQNDQVWERPRTPYRARYVQAPVYDGDWALQTGIPTDGPNVYSHSTAQQRFTIPTNAVSAQLKFYLYMTSGELSNPRLPNNLPDELDPRTDALASDAQYVLLLNQYQQILRRLMFVYGKNDPEWREYTYDLSTYQGRTLYIHFGTFNDGSDGTTAMYVDLVTLTVCVPTASQIHVPFTAYRYNPSEHPVTPTPTPTPTDTPTPTPTSPSSPLPTPTPTPTSPSSPLPTPTPTPTSPSSPLPTPTPTPSG